MTIINKTPHEVNVVTRSGELIATFHPDGDPIRLDLKWRPHRSLENGVMLFSKVETIINAPLVIDGTLYIVSLPVKMAMPARPDLITPIKIVKDLFGIVQGCQGFAV